MVLQGKVLQDYRSIIFYACSWSLLHPREIGRFRNVQKRSSSGGDQLVLTSSLCSAFSEPRRRNRIGAVSYCPWDYAHLFPPVPLLPHLPSLPPLLHLLQLPHLLPLLHPM